MISQPNSALARADSYITLAMVALTERNYEEAHWNIGMARSALGFAGNSQTRLIEAAKVGLRNAPDSTVADDIQGAIDHAEGPGID